MSETKIQSQLVYLSKRPFIAFDFFKHFKIYEKASDLFDEDEGDVFNGEKTSWLDFFSSYSELLGLLQEFGFKPSLIENSLFISKREDPNEPEYLLVAFNQHKDMLRQYVHGVKKNVLGKKIGTKQFNSITHHKGLATNPYYYKQYSSNSFAKRTINLNLRNIEYCIKSYKRKPFEEKGIGELLKAIENFFDEVVSDYSALERNSKSGKSNTSDLAILIPFPRPGASFLRHVNLAGGCFFLFGSMEKNKSVEKLIARVRQYFVDSLLQRTMLKSTIDSTDIVGKEKWVHWIKSNLERNIISKLYQLKSEPSEVKYLDQTITFTQKFKEDTVKMLKAIRFQYAEFDHYECKKVIENCISTFTDSGVSIQLEYNYNGGEVYTHLDALEIIISMILDNAIKYMDKFWRSNMSSGRKKIQFQVNKVLVESQPAFEIAIFNNGTEVNEKTKAVMGKYAPKGLSEGSTGWGFIIIYEALQKMDAYIFHEINNYLKIDNVTRRGGKGVEVCFRLRTNT